jgi:hypothetical protein
MENDSKPNENKTAPQTASAPASDAKSTSASGSGKTNTLAIIAIICSIIIAPVGLVLGIVALSQIKKTKEGGHGLALASIIISIVIMLFQFLAVAIFWGAIFSINKAANDAGVSVNTNTGTVSVNKDGNSAQIGEGVKLPDGFPSAMPIYSGAKLSAASKTNGTDYTVTATTNDSVDKVVNYYKTQLASNGWTIDSSSDSSDSSGKGTLISASTSSLSGSVGVYGGSGNSTTIIIAVYPKSN